MFFKAGRTGDNSWYWYILVILITFIGWQIIGALPLLAVTFLRASISEDFTLADMGELSDMSVLYSYFPDKNMLLFLILLTFVFAALFFWGAIKFLQKKPLKSVLTGAQKYRWPRFWFAFGLTMLFVLATAVYTYFAAPDDVVMQFNAKKWIPLLIIAAIMIPIQSGWEEAFFRGYLMQGFAFLTKNRLVALIVTTLFFALLHMANPEVLEHGVLKMFPLYFGMGLIFGILVLMDNGLELAMGLHIANNLGLALFFTSPESALQTDAVFTSLKPNDPSEGAVQLLIFGAVIIAIFAWKYKWKDWGQRLTGRVSAKPDQQLYA